MKILLVEPDRELGRTIASALEADDHKVMIKRNAQDGLDGLDHHQPDLVILELQLGKHNGVEFLYELNSHGDWLNIPVIIYTHNSDALSSDFTKAWRQLDVKQILYKPDTSIARLKKAISTVKT